MKKLLSSLVLLLLMSLSTNQVKAVTVNCVNNCPDLSPGTTSGEWPMVGANLQRTSWNTEAVRGNQTVDWYTQINNVQGGTGKEVKMQSSEPIAADGKIFISTSVGLVAFNAETGAGLWTYGTNMPLSGSLTYANGTVYVGGFDRRLYAVNSSDGKLKTGWTFTEAGAGFETGPLVVNNKVYIGNRDGFMYCFDANTGALIWKWHDSSDEWPEAPIRFAAAYKNGILYWGQDNARAYALDVSGSTPTLKWKSVKFPGVGFTSYWTVLYHDKSSNQDYVLLSGSKKSVTSVWFGGTHYFEENYAIFGGGAPLGTLVGALGNVAGDWVSGTVTIDASKIQQYFANNPTRRHLVVLNAANGNEFTPYAPVNWVSVTHGGDKRPPVVDGLDGVIYTHIGYQYGPDANSYPNMGASGCISGWKFGTQYISRICNFVRGVADETVHFTGGGEKIYWSEGFNMGYGSFDMNKIYLSNNQVDYSSCGCMWGCLGSGIPCGGGTSPMIPYKDRLYMFEGNTLMAFKSGATLNANSTVTISAPTASVSATLSPSVIQQRLENEVTKILNAGFLRPGFMDSGFWGAYINIGYEGDPLYGGDHLSDYFHTPTDTIYTLFRAYPLLPQSLKDQVITYIKTYYGVGKIADVTKYAHVGWKNGALREIYDDPPELAAAMLRPTENTNSNVVSIPRTTYFNPTPNWPKIYNFPQDAFYGAWKYAQLVPAEAQSIWTNIQGKLEAPVADSLLITFPHVLNQYINGYTGYVELGKIVGANVSSQQTTLTRLINLRTSNFTTADPFPAGSSYTHTLNYARNFMYMTPELADSLKTIKSSVQKAVDDAADARPYWFVTKLDQTPGEGVFDPLYTYNALFQARALILDQDYATLSKYIDAPAFWRGDLFYIQDLVALIEANGGTGPTASPNPFKPGDTDHDGDVDFSDFNNFKNDFNTSSVRSDFNGNGVVDIYDYNLLVDNFGK